MGFQPAKMIMIYEYVSGETTGNTWWLWLITYYILFNTPIQSLNRSRKCIRAGPILGETLVDTFFVYKQVIDSSFWVVLLVLVAAVNAAVTVAIAVDVQNVMK